MAGQSWWSCSLPLKVLAANARDLNGQTIAACRGVRREFGAYSFQSSDLGGSARPGFGFVAGCGRGREFARFTRKSDWGPAGRVHVNAGWNGGRTPLDLRDCGEQAIAGS